ncbi:LysE family translocator [Pseudomaricurvus sp. HS19]|uniref:LysE family translocator n=1 Tax=Pseudomaricurvus sp. HS19 TaxID=2692626 RepID=UPI00136A2A5B|nr:LysE family translocator [Pseudomaricurvus sp. HS19]MYM64500.1 LysE family transporter [Pseudomaricurvus sp. HS19]
MSWIEWLTLAGLCWLGAASPGPSLAVIIGQTLQGGKAQGLVAAIAHGVGVGVYALLAAVGLALLVTQTPWLYDGLRWIGAGFLLWLAWQSWRAPVDYGQAGEATLSRRRGALTGFLTAFLNPKLALFFLAVYTQFLTAQMPLLQKLTMASVSAGVDAGWYVVVVMLVSRPRVLDGLRAHGGLLQRVFALLLVAVALRVLW